MQADCGNKLVAATYLNTFIQHVGAKLSIQRISKAPGCCSKYMVIIIFCLLWLVVRSAIQKIP